MILVTHDMSAVEHYCHRAILLHDGVVADAGDPDIVARSYLRLNFENVSSGVGDVDDFGEAPELQMVGAKLLGPDGAEVNSVEQGDDLRLEAVFEASRTIERPSFGFTFVNADGSASAASARTSRRTAARCSWRPVSG